VRAALLLLVVLACERGPTVVGAPADPAALARDTQVLTDQSMGSVVLRGTVGQVCDTGCWFYLLDDTSLLFVQLDLATGLSIPTDSQGEPVLVKGRIVDEAGQRVLHAETVVLGATPAAPES
jgi:hypothetical protein